MPAYNFQRRFAPLVESGQKRQTIRQPRKRQTKAGDILKLYTGQRTKQCRLLGEFVCIEVTRLEIGQDYIATDNGIDYSWPQIRELAEADGFDRVEDFFNFFRYHYGFPAELELIKW